MGVRATEERRWHILDAVREIVVATVATFGKLNRYGSEMLLHSCLKRMSKYGAAAAIRAVYTDTQLVSGGWGRLNY